MSGQRRKDNPWRTDADWDKKDHSLREFDNSALEYQPRLFFHFIEALTKPSAYGIATLRGPRRVGKTTLVKLLIRELLSRGVGKSNIRYFSLDAQDPEGQRLSPLELVRGTPSNGKKDNYLFLDEVSFNRTWATQLKNAFDEGLIEDFRLRVVATGSHSMDIAEAVRQLRGRQGAIARTLNLGGNVLQSPLRFSEVVESLQPEVRAYFARSYFRGVPKRFASLTALAAGSIPDGLKYVYDNYFQLLQGTLDDYLLHGGYAHAIDEFNSQSPHQVSDDFYYNVADLLINDCEAIGLDPENLRRLIQYLVDPDRISNEFNLQGSGQVVVRSEEGLPSGRFEKRRYLDYLRTTWSFFFPYREDDPCVPNYQGLQKDYVLDPFLYHALYARVNNIAHPFRNSRSTVADPIFKGKLVECVLGSHLLLSQFLFEHIPDVNFDRVLMYQRTGDGENDFVLCVTKNNVPHRVVLESKFSSNPSGYNSIPANRKIVITKDRLEVHGRVVYVPASVFLLLF